MRLTSRQPSRRALDSSRARFVQRTCSNRTALHHGFTRSVQVHAPIVVVRRRLWPPPFRRWFWTCWFCADEELVTDVPPGVALTPTRVLRPVSRPNGGDDDDSR